MTNWVFNFAIDPCALSYLLGEESDDFDFEDGRMVHTYSDDVLKLIARDVSLEKRNKLFAIVQEESSIKNVFGSQTRQLMFHVFFYAAVTVLHICCCASDVFADF